MTTPKIITADDVQQGKLTIIRRGGTLHVERRYEFVDAVDVIIPEMKPGRLVTEVAIASLPANIVTALQDIDTWTYNQILAQEGMEDL